MLVAVAVALTLLPALPAVAQKDVFQTITPDQFLAIMRAEGQDASIGPLGEDTVINWEISGFKAVIYFFGEGKSIQFYGGVSGNGSLEKVNAFNRDYRFARTYINNRGNPCLELDLDLEGGVTRARIVDYLTTCRMILARWLTDVISAD
jgi:hypothetical protein